MIIVSFFSFCSLSISSAEEGSIEPRAKEILKQMGEYIRTANEFTLKAEVFFDVVYKDSQMIRYTATPEAAVKRPNKFQVDFHGDIFDNRIFYNGKTITIFDSDTEYYATHEVPDTIDATMDFISENLDLTLPLSDFSLSDPYSKMIKNVKSGIYVGMDELHGTWTHHLAFTQEDIDWQIWIEDGKQTVPRMLVIDYKNVKGSPQYTAIITDWDFYPRLADSLFEFIAPDEAIQIEFLSSSSK